LSSDEDLIAIALEYLMRFLKVPHIHPVFISLTASLLLALSKVGISVDCELLPRSVLFVPYAVTQHLFILLVRRCDSDRNEYGQMAILIPELTPRLAEEIGDGIEIDDDDGTSGAIICSPMFHLLNQIVGVCEESEYGDTLFAFCTSIF
jgi:hypothetical protein